MTQLDPNHGWVATPTVFLRDQIRAALSEVDPEDPVSVRDLMDMTGISQARRQDVQSYVRKLERVGLADRYECESMPGRVFYGPSTDLLDQFQIRLPPLRVREPKRPRKSGP